jgi:hypothetical protein
MTLDEVSKITKSVKAYSSLISLCLSSSHISIATVSASSSVQQGKVLISMILHGIHVERAGLSTAVVVVEVEKQV